jgi:23S rRNA (adenine2503-C2)-methyltransferase
MNIKKDIREIALSDLRDIFTSANEKPYRAEQVHDWLWNKSATSFEEMSNLPAQVRDWLSEKFVINAIKIDKMQVSTDRTIKNAFRLHDGHIIEGVLIPTETRMTACVSSQVGCSLTCKFCATC